LFLKNTQLSNLEILNTMTERKPLTLNPGNKDLLKQRAHALRVLNQATTREGETSALPSQRYTPPTEPVLLRPRKRTVIVNPAASVSLPALPVVPPDLPIPPAAPPVVLPPPSAPVTVAQAPVPQTLVVPSPERMRLNKRMAELGLCSRRESDVWIKKGWVRVNGELAVTGQQVHVSDRIEVAPEVHLQQEQQVTILLNKPVGYVSGQAEDGHAPAVSLITPRTHWTGDSSRVRFNFKQLQGLAPAGRLDIDSVGLLVLTQDGRVARQLIGEDSEVEKEYLVRVGYITPNGGVIHQHVQNVFPADRLALLRNGLSLDGERLKPAQVSWQNPEQLRFVLTEGKKRQIRRMCELVGLTVMGLKRIRIGNVMLGNLPPGKWRYLGTHERF
jgi:23S rRNA pseudouridine2604 synthase